MQIGRIILCICSILAWSALATCAHADGADVMLRYRIPTGRTPPAIDMPSDATNINGSDITNFNKTSKGSASETPSMSIDLNVQESSRKGQPGAEKSKLEVPLFDMRKELNGFQLDIPLLDKKIPLSNKY